MLFRSIDIEKCRRPISFFNSLAFPGDVSYNANTIKIIHPKAEPFQNSRDGHILSISIAGFLHTLIEGERSNPVLEERRELGYGNRAHKRKYS